MNRKQMQSLISAGVFAAALLGGLAYADDAPMDPSMPMNTGAETKPVSHKKHQKDKKRMDTSMPMNAATKTKPVDHTKHKDHKKHLKDKKPMDKAMKMPADSPK